MISHRDVELVLYYCHEKVGSHGLQLPDIKEKHPPRFLWNGFLMWWIWMIMSSSMSMMFIDLSNGDGIGKCNGKGREGNLSIKAAN